jgi:hypothetical protein
MARKRLRWQVKARHRGIATPTRSNAESPMRRSSA